MSEQPRRASPDTAAVASRELPGAARAAESISVVIPCHNDAPYLGDALASVVSQTVSVREIIVVDDGSTDGSADVARAAGDTVRLIMQPNLGVSAARNAGAAASVGTWIAFLDADDLWTSDSLEARLACAWEDPQIDCVFGAVEHFLSPDLPEAEAARLLCPAGAVAARFAGSMLVRRSVLEGIGGFDPRLRIGETIDLVARLTEHGAVTATAPRLVMRRRIHGQNMTIQKRVGHGDYLRVLKAKLDRQAHASRREGPAS